jgi:hypothetical protein
MKKGIFIILLMGLVGLNWAIEWSTQRHIEQLKRTLLSIASVGRLKVEVEQGFDAQSLEHVFGLSDNVIYGGKEVGRYRLFYSTVLIYKVFLDSSGQVMRVETNVFNDGL